MVGIKIKMPKGCIYENEKGKTEYCPLCNHDDVPYCQYLDDDEVGASIGERPCYCPLVEIEETPDKRTETHACDCDRNETHGGLISRQAAIDAIQNEVEPFVIVEPGTTCIMGAGVKDDDVIRVLEQLPPAEPEQKKGKWIDETFKPWGLVHHPYKCDQCGEHSEADSNFCPNCGADMRGNNNEID